MKLLKTRTFYFRSTCANFSRNSWSSFLLFSSLSSSRLSQASSEARKLLSAAFWWETNVSNALPIFVKVSVVDSLRFFVAGLKNGLLASLVFYAKEYKKSLNAEVKVENKSCGRLFKPILISILLYKSIHLGSKIVKKLLEITDSAGADIETFSWLITWPFDQRKFSKLTCQTFTPVSLRKFAGCFVVAAAAGAASEGRQLFVWFLVLNIFMVFFFIVRLSDNFWRIYHNLRFGTWFF